MKILNTKNIPQQKGVVLIVALVFLIALTAAAAALMNNTSTDIKMSGATQEKSIATQEALSEIDRVIFTQYRKINGQNAFAKKMNNVVNLNSTLADTIAMGQNANQNGLDVVECPRTLNAISSNIVGCTMVRVAVARNYGRDMNHTVLVNSGVSQVIMETK